MYTHPNQVARIATDTRLTKPFYLCEYAHAMFNSLGSVGEYNDLFDKYPNLMGGAIWEWEDQGIWNRRDPNHVILAYGGGFGEVPNDHYFIHKGVVFSDRTPKPHYPEVKRAYQWIGFKAADLAAGKVTIQNKYQFTNLDRFQPVWTLSEDGSVIAEGQLPILTLGPGEEKQVAVKLDVTPRLGAEYQLRIAFQLRQDEKWARAGYEVAAMPFRLPISTAPVAADNARMKPVSFTQDDKQITVRGDGFKVVFDRAEGTIARLVRNDVNVLAFGGGPKLHLWRAPHRNDDMWAYNDWVRYGLRDLKRQTIRLVAEQAGPSAVSVAAVVQADGKTGFRVLHSARYTVYGDGSIAVDNAVVPQGRRIPLARMGVRLLLDRQLDHFTYLGRGPMENYADRKRGSDVALYTSLVREQQTPYAKPMECGNHEDVRWAALTGGVLPGLMAQADGRLLQVSALPYTDEELESPEYTIDLPASKASVLCLSSKTLGAGSNGCGPRPLDPYLVWSEPATFSYVLRLLPDGTKDLASLGRTVPPANRVKPVVGQRDSKGQVVLTCGTAGAQLEYALDGTSWQVYSAPLELQKAGVVEVRARVAEMIPYQGAVVIPAMDRRLRWKAIAASSFQPDEGEPANVLDGSPDTYWHSRWSPDVARPPHHLVIDFAEPLHLTAVVYTARRENPNGRVKDYEIYFGGDGQHWGHPAVKGRFPRGEPETTIHLPRPVTARYMKFVALSEQANQPFASVAELNVVEAEK